MGGRGDQGRETRKLSVAAGDVCPVCQEEMEVNGRVFDPTGPAGSLTYCRDGCGNNMHARWAARSRGPAVHDGNN